MTLKQIEYFLKVCETGNISTAAETLFVSRSVVSRTINELEEEFGAVLFIRSRSGVSMTEAGAILARLFENFTVGCATTKGRIACLSTQAHTVPLRLGVTPTNAYCIYKNYLEAFQKLNPEIRLHVTEYSAFDACHRLLNGVIDAAFTPARPDECAFFSMDLYCNPVMLGVSEGDRRVGYKAGIGDILDLPLGFFSAPMPLEHILEASFEAVGKKPNIVLRTSDQMLLKELTVSGKLYPILPLDMMATWEGTRQVPLDFFPASMNRIVWSRALTPSPALAVFLEFMRDQTV